jgi:hypothetical protein
MLDDPALFLVGTREFAVLQNIQAGSGAHTVSCLIGTGEADTPVEWLGCEVNHALLSCARVKKVWSYASTLHICFRFTCMGTTLRLLIWIYVGGLLKESKFFPEPLV